VKSAGAQGVELEEYPGRVFHFSAVSSSMTDLTRSLPSAAQNSLARGRGEAGNPAQAGFPACSSVCRPGLALPGWPGPRALHTCGQVSGSRSQASALLTILSCLEVWFYGFRGGSFSSLSVVVIG
jgi:hypothetical protein